tara:strand:+ start:90249 stop:90491 length:243 start_codon:yes stop_codon:yes gene_type:complete
MITSQFAEFFGWMSVINIFLLFFSTFMVVRFREVPLKIHNKLFSISEKDLLKAYFTYLARFKVLIITFNIVPYFALKLMA